MITDADREALLSATHDEDALAIVERIVAQARADALQAFADTRGVDIGDDDSDWWQGYQSAQRECLRDARAVLADALNGWTTFPVWEGLNGSQMPMTQAAMIHVLADALAEAGLLAGSEREQAEARADERERIAQAIEARRDMGPRRDPLLDVRVASYTIAATIAREGADALERMEFRGEE